MPHPSVATLLIAEDDADVRDALAELLGSVGYRVLVAHNGYEATRILQEQGVDVIITDVRMPGIGGIDLCKFAFEDRPGVPVIVITAYGDVNSALEALRAGAFDFLGKPLNSARLVELIDCAVAEQKSTGHISRWVNQNSVENLEIVGTSFAADHLRQQLALAANADCTVLVTGERGTGKRLIARLIHRLSSRRHTKLTELDFTAPWFSSDGHGAVNHSQVAESDGHPRNVLSADPGGTVMIRGIELAPPHIQDEVTNLLRLQRSIPSECADIRVLATSELNPLTLGSNDSFLGEVSRSRNVMTITVPPLRHRDLDVIAIANALLSKWAPSCGQFTLSSGAEQMLKDHRWPGNVRELEDALKVAMTASSNHLIDVQDLPSNIRAPGSSHSSQQIESLEQLERKHIASVLEAHRGNKVLTARALGIDRATLYRKLNRLGLNDATLGRPIRGQQ